MILRLSALLSSDPNRTRMTPVGENGTDDGIAKRDDKYFAEKKRLEKARSYRNIMKHRLLKIFMPSTPKTFAVPGWYASLFRSTSNRRGGKFFFSLFFRPSQRVARTVMQVYRRFANQLSYFGMYGMARTDEDLVCVTMLLTSDYRLADVKSAARNSPVEAFFYATVGKCIEFCKRKYGQRKSL
ncbi:hypothetical protein AVEN_65009-1 [Araneus ventricosus]|uniref:Uncharacterized protein n=1 Tax=Araneus ventricosus TaxID=182803 RepID=A0A4Y2UE00_ARAVE|nr:hypothetical protein AVEN_65009-1 [Araneus ventricosus]